ncbi:hypothetical protein AAFC00_006108 [Neodothiora populina]|uniref:AB hydrolase-1 domain-containing protein n=1 Tax=Neodothiora populina TaxID=2781224 RepID=A0ABR3P4B9_9PEZI
MDDENPTQCQWAPPGQYPRKIPIVLIHDGGGTTFAYHILGELNRDVYVVHNPNYWTGEPWAEGMDAQACHYIQLIKKAGISGNILLGGWSLGGFLSVTMARMIAADRSEPRLHVKGMVIIDSPFHTPLKDLSVETAKPELSHLPELVRKSLHNCGALLADWSLPEWDADAYKDRGIRTVVDSTSADVDVPAGQVWYKPLKGPAEVVPVSRASPPPAKADPDASHDVPPFSVLLRCVDRAPSTDPDSTKPAHIDIRRDQLVLGWDENYPEFIKAVIDVDAHHYNLFEFERIDAQTDKINLALKIVDNLRPLDGNESTSDSL